MAAIVKFFFFFKFNLWCLKKIHENPNSNLTWNRNYYLVFINYCSLLSVLFEQAHISSRTLNITTTTLCYSTLSEGTVLKSEAKKQGLPGMRGDCPRGWLRNHSTVARVKPPSPEVVFQPTCYCLIIPQFNINVHIRRGFGSWKELK